MSDFIGIQTELPGDRLIAVYHDKESDDFGIHIVNKGEETCKIRLTSDAMDAIAELYLRHRAELLDTEKDYEFRYEYREVVDTIAD